MMLRRAELRFNFGKGIEGITVKLTLLQKMHWIRLRLYNEEIIVLDSTSCKVWEEIFGFIFAPERSWKVPLLSTSPVCAAFVFGCDKTAEKAEHLLNILPLANPARRKHSYESFVQTALQTWTSTRLFSISTPNI
jgi:hypothetical protein